LRFATEELKADREIVLAVVSKKGYALKYVAEELKADREIVLAAVSQNGSAGQFAAEELTEGGSGDRLGCCVTGWVCLGICI